MRAVKNLITNIIDWFLYTFLSDRQKEKLSNLFSERQKELLRKITQHGKRRQQKLYVKKIKDNIYSLGLREKGLQQLKAILNESKDNFLKRLVAWELVLYYANLETKAGAEEALQYIEATKNGEKDLNQQRRIAIIEAECLQKTNEKARAKEVLEEQLEKEEHEDLYLALANLEKTAQKRLSWINKVYEKHQLNPITFQSKNEPNYNDLRMEKNNEAIHSDSKITVIIPAYNAGEGLRVAVESILNQTWQNIELIIVDDCSTDDTLQIAKEYEEKDERVIVRQTAENSGPYVARNIALKIASGDFITVNDADDWSHEQKLEIQANHLLENEHMMANTSAHARLTEDLYFYRRGTPGRYVFPNMSSIMFRRKPVMEKLGFWDSVRFAADGEFKRRLLQTFGEQAFMDLPSGPLSLPRQAVASLTSSSAFGYNGFFMGARKEFVESFMHYYKTADSLYYPFPLVKRFYPVPEPMWPKREIEKGQDRIFDLVLAGDFRQAKNFEDDFQTLQAIIEPYRKERIGLVQLYTYDLDRPIEIADEVRQLAQDENLQILVYGEKIATEKLLFMGYNVDLDEQIYIPTIKTENLAILVKNTDKMEQLSIFKESIEKIYKQEPAVIPWQETTRQELMSKNKTMPLAEENWV